MKTQAASDAVTTVYRECVRFMLAQPRRDMRDYARAYYRHILFQESKPDAPRTLRACEALEVRKGILGIVRSL